MAKTQGNSNRNWQHWMMLFVCASAALTALGLSAYLYTEIDSIARRLDEQATRLADLDHSTATQTTAKPPTNDCSPDPNGDCSQDREQQDTCRLGDGCYGPDGTKSPIPSAHLRASIPLESEGKADDDEHELEWEVELLSGGMQILMQKLIVPRSGHYFVYSQMEFGSDISGKAAGHMTKVNDQTVFDGSEGTGGGQYYSGVLQLRGGDQISVTPTKKKRRIMRHLHRNASFFGAFWVDTTTVQTASDDN